MFDLKQIWWMMTNLYYNLKSVLQHNILIWVYILRIANMKNEHYNNMYTANN